MTTTTALSLALLNMMKVWEWNNKYGPLCHLNFEWDAILANTWTTYYTKVVILSAKLVISMTLAFVYRMTQYQCDQMIRLLFKNLAI